MKAIVVVDTIKGFKCYEFEDYNELKDYYEVTGYTENLSELRKKGRIVHREELDGKPILKGLCGPMWDGGKLRYESWKVYDMLSR